MILLLDTSTPICKLTLVAESGPHATYEWQADRNLARDLLGYMRDRLTEHNMTFEKITAIGVMKGPGSFTGLRIGATVANTLARELCIPIVGEVGEEWVKNALNRLNESQSDAIVLPEYGRPARITAARK